jgi:hypothetical protein
VPAALAALRFTSPAPGAAGRPSPSNGIAERLAAVRSRAASACARSLLRWLRSAGLDDQVGDKPTLCAGHGRTSMGAPRGLGPSGSSPADWGGPRQQRLFALVVRLGRRPRARFRGVTVVRSCATRTAIRSCAGEGRPNPLRDIRTIGFPFRSTPRVGFVRTTFFFCMAARRSTSGHRSFKNSVVSVYAAGRMEWVGQCSGRYSKH